MTSYEEMPEFRLTHNDVHASSFAVSPPAVYHSHLYSDEYSVTEGGHPHTAHLHPADGMSFYSHGMLSTPVGLDQQVQRDHAPLWLGGMPMVLESSPTLLPPSAVNEAHNDDISSGSLNAYESGRHGAHLGHATYDPHQTLWPGLLDGQLLLSPAENLGHGSFDALSAYRSFSSTFHAAHPHYSSPSKVIAPSIPFNIPLHRPPSPPVSHWLPYLYPLPDCHPHVAQRDCTPSLCHRRGAHAVEYGGLWLDAAELRKALMETDGKLTVFQCLWEHDHSPCHIWIKGDRSYINAHIQKWHGGKPGGEKLEVDCHWSSCGKRMRKESITRHILSVHLGELWECQGCGKEIARSDAHRRHTVDSDSEACRTLGALVTYSADARAIDVSAALTGEGRLRYIHV